MSPLLRLAACACFSCSVLTLSGAAVAQNEPEPRPERRSGFVASVVGGLSVGAAGGNPSAQSDRYDPAHHTSTGLAYGYRVTPYIGGALTDWFTFGLGGAYGYLQTSSAKSALGLFLFRIETFPLFYKGGVFRDLGLSLDFGAGSTNIKDKSSGDTRASSSVASTIGAGLFYEGWRLGPIALGPSVAWQHNWSDWFSRDDVTLGLKVTFYGGP